MNKHKEAQNKMNPYFKTLTDMFGKYGETSPDEYLVYPVNNEDQTRLSLYIFRLTPEAKAEYENLVGQNTPAQEIVSRLKNDVEGSEFIAQKDNIPSHEISIDSAQAFLGIQAAVKYQLDLFNRMQSLPKSKQDELWEKLESDPEITIMEVLNGLSSTGSSNDTSAPEPSGP